MFAVVAVAVVELLLLVVALLVVAPVGGSDMPVVSDGKLWYAFRHYNCFCYCCC